MSSIVPGKPSGYTTGEARRMIAPLVGLDPGQIREYLVLVVTDDGRLFHGNNSELTVERAGQMVTTFEADCWAGKWDTA